jgi:two-component system response regulator HydG
VIHETLRHTRGDKRLTAKLLGIATRTIYRRLETSDPESAEQDDDRSSAEPAERVASPTGDKDAESRDGG